MTRLSRLILPCLLGAACLAASGLVAPATARADEAPAAGARAGGNVAPGQQGVDAFYLGKTIPLDLPFQDADSGRRLTLAEAARGPDGRTLPVVLQIGYFLCPQVCRETRRALAARLQGSAGLAVGRDLAVLCVSIDPEEGVAEAARARADAAAGQDAAAAGWRYLLGDEVSIAGLTDSSGYKYAYSVKTRQFQHPAVLIVVTPDGRVSDYLDGYGRDGAELRRSVAAASGGAIAKPRVNAFNACVSNALSWSARNAIKLMMMAGIVTVVSLGAFIHRMCRIESARRAAWAKAASPSSTPNPSASPV